MKAILIALIVFSANFSHAFQGPVSPENMTPQQQQQLIQLLNQLEPEIIDSLLTDEALEWYINQFTRGEQNNDHVQPSIHPVDFGTDPFNDPNAPKLSN